MFTTTPHTETHHTTHNLHPPFFYFRLLAIGMYR